MKEIESNSEKVISERVTYNGYWVIRSYGNITTRSEFDNRRIKMVVYSNWLSFVRDCEMKTTGMMVFDESFNNQTESILKKRLRRIVSISEKKNIPWGVKAINERTWELSEFYSGCLMVYKEDEGLEASLQMINAFDVSTHAERVLLNGRLVVSPKERRICQAIHRLWRAEFGKLLTEVSGWQRKRSFRTSFNFSTNAISFVLQETIKVALGLGYNYEAINALFLKYSNKELPQQLSSVFSAWSVELKLRVKDEVQ